MYNHRIRAACGLLVFVAAFTALSFATSTAASRPHPLFGNTMLGNSAEIFVMWPDYEWTAGQAWPEMRVSDCDSVGSVLSLLPGAPWSQTGVGNARYQMLDAASGDFDGDGREDVVSAYTRGNPGPWTYDLWLLVSNMPAGDYTEQHGEVELQPNTHRDPGNVRLAAGNFDTTDTKEFVLATRAQDAGAMKIKLELMRLDSLTRHPVSLATAWSEQQPDGLTESQRFDVAAGDFDGDGVDEIALGGVRGTSNATRQMFLAVFAYQGGQLVQKAIGMSETLTPGGGLHAVDHIDHVAIATGPTGGRLVDQVALTWGRTSSYWTSQLCMFCCPLPTPNYQYYYHRTLSTKLAHLTVTTSGPSWQVGGWSRTRQERTHGYDDPAGYCPVEVVADRQYTGPSLGVDVADLNGDGIAEILWAAADRLTVFGVSQDSVLTELTYVEKAIRYNDPSRRIVQVADLDPHPGKATVWRPEIVLQDWGGSGTKLRTRVFRPTTNANNDITGLTLLITSEEDAFSCGSSMAMVCGDFDGDAIRLGPPKRLLVTNVIRPEIYLGAPPVHYAWSGAEEWDVNGCYPNHTCDDFAAHYTQETTQGQAVTTAVKMDWGLSTALQGSLEAQVPGVGSAKVEATLKSTFGVNFGRTGSLETTFQVTNEAWARGGDRVLAARMNYVVWEYPVYEADRHVMGNLAVVVPDPEGPVRLWYTSDGWLGANQGILHEPGNLLSYPSQVPETPPDGSGSLWKSVPGFQVPPPFGMSSALESPAQSGGISLTSTDLTTEEQTLGWDAGFEVGAKVTLESDVMFGSLKAGMSAEVTGSYLADQMETHRIRVGNEINIQATLGYLDPGFVDAYYTVWPFIYRAKSGVLVLDYAVTLDGPWWTNHYGAAPDLTLILPRFYSVEKGYGLDDPTTRYASPDVKITPPYVPVGDTARVFVTVRNYSLAWQTGDVSVKLFAGDPGEGGIPLSDLTGNSTFVISGGIGPRASEPVTVDFVVPPTIRDTLRVYAVLDPLGAVAELRENNNKGYGVLYTSGYPVGVLPEETPLVARLDPNAPNPFTSATRIHLVVPAAGRTSLRIYDVAGRRVATLVDAELPAGPYTFQWEGRGDNGRAVGPGVYFYQARCGTFTGTRRMLVVR